MNRERIGWVLALLLSSTVAAANVPDVFTVQGVLRDGAGKLQSTMVSVTVKLFDAQSMGNQLAGPYQQMVMANNGLFTVNLTDSGLATELKSAAEVWVEVAVGSSTFPRQQLTSEVYAIMAGHADRADSLSAACSGCVSDAMIGTVAGTKVTGKVQAAMTADMASNVVNGVVTTGSYANPSWITSLDASKITGTLTNVMVNGANVTGKVASAANADTVTNGVYTTGSYSNPSWITMLDGTKITGTVANAMTAVNFSGMLAGDVTGPQTATSIAKLQGVALASTTPTAGQVLKYNAGQMQWAPGPDNNSGGSVTRVDTGAGLSGGPITGAGMLSVLVNMNGGLTASLGAGTNELGIAAGGIQPAMLSNGTYAINISGTAANFSGSLGGDVSGTQVAASVVGIRGKPISNTPPNNGQILKYDNTAGQWVPSADANSGGTVTRVDTGAGLTGGPVTGSGSIMLLVSGMGGLTTSQGPGLNELGIAANGIVPGMVANGIYNINISGNAANFSGVLGGDVAGAQTGTTVVGLRGKLISGAPPTDGQVLKYSAAQMQWVPSATAAGTVTRIDTGIGLSGGPISSTGMISVLLNASGGLAGTLGVGMNEIGIGPAGIVPSMVGPGTYAINISGNASGFSGMLNGDVGGPQGATVVGKLQGYPVSITQPPTNGQVLLYNGGAGQWQPGTVTAANGTVTGVSASPPLMSSGGNSPNISLVGLIPIANGGTGTVSAPTTGGQFLRSAAANSWAVGTIGAGDLPATIGSDTTGNAATVTNGVVTTGSYANPTWLTSIKGNIVTTAVANATTATNFSGSLAGDVNGNQSSTTVAKIQGVSVSSAPPGNGQVLQYNAGSSSWVPAAAASGTVTSITTGAGLTGGPITGSGMISIVNGGVTNGMLMNASVTVSAGSGLSGGGLVALGGTVALGNTGILTLGGSPGILVSGGQNPTISLGVVAPANGGTGLNSGPASTGQFLRASAPGTWAAATIQAGDLPPLSGDVNGSVGLATVVGLQGKALSSNPPTDGQVLQYSATQMKWLPTSLAPGGVINVTAGMPLASTGGANPNITLNGMVPIMNGGTGISTPPAGAGQYLRSSGAGNWAVSAIQPNDITGVVDLASAQTITGLKTFQASTPSPSLVAKQGIALGPQPILDVESSGGASIFSVSMGGAVNAGGVISASGFVGNGGGIMGILPGNISAGTAAISISGNAATANSATSFTGPLVGDVSGTQSATKVAALQGTAVANVVPTDQQVLQYSAAQMKWLPTSLAPGGVMNVGANAPLSSTGGATPTISLTGTVGAGNGGTGISTFAAGTYLRASGANTWSASAIQAGDIPSLSGSYVDLTTTFQNIPVAKIFQTSADTASLLVRQTTFGAPTKSIFAVTNAANTVTFFDIGTAGNGNFSGAVTATSFNGVGTGLTALNPANLSAGTAGINITGSAASATSFTGPLGGDVTGTQTANSVGKIQGVAVSATAPANGQVLAFNGANWVPTTATAGVTSVTGNPPIMAAGASAVTLSLGTVGPINGGTGITTFGAGTYLRASGANTWAATTIQASDIPSLAGSYVDLSTALQVVPVPKIFQPTSGDVQSLIVKQTSQAGPTKDVFDVANNAGTVNYFAIGPAGNASFSGSLTAAAFSGNGAALSSLNPANLSAGTAAISISGNAATATTATTATNFTGMLTGDVTGTQSATKVIGLQNVPVAAGVPTNGHVLKYDSVLMAWHSALDNNSGGTVTSVGTGAGLSGGPITGVGTISIANAGVTNAMLQFSSIPLTTAAPLSLTQGTMPATSLTLGSSYTLSLGVVPAANGGTGLTGPTATNQFLRSDALGTSWVAGAIGPADITNGYVDLVSNQAINGYKTFGNPVTFSTSGAQLSPGAFGNLGVVELGASNAFVPAAGTSNQPYIDFHYWSVPAAGMGAASDYNVRLVNDGDGQLSLLSGSSANPSPKLYLPGPSSGNLSAFVIGGCYGGMTSEQGGSLELGADNLHACFNTSPFIDFHYVGAMGNPQDYNVRIQNSSDATLMLSAGTAGSTPTLTFSGTGGFVTNATYYGNGSWLTGLNGANINAGTVTATQIAAKTITANEIAPATITSVQVAKGMGIVSDRTVFYQTPASSVVIAPNSVGMLASAACTGNDIPISGGCYSNAYASVVIAASYANFGVGLSTWGCVFKNTDVTFAHTGSAFVVCSPHP